MPVYLGMESTAHTLGIGIFDGDVKANVWDQYLPEKGILPREAADHHSRVFASTLKRALSEAGLSMDDVDVIAVAQGPGIGAPLSFGVSMAKFLAAYYGKPIVGVNHPYAHVKIAEWDSGVDGDVVVYMSGGNSQILAKRDELHYDVLGETLDIGIGNLFDTFARKAGITPAHGSKLAEVARGGRYVELPYTVKGMNLQFSGLLTAALKALEKHSIEDVSYSLIETALYMVAEVAERAIHLKKARGVVICGGVAQNARFKEIMKAIAEENGIALGIARDEYNRDNGAMIAYAGKVIYEALGPHDLEKLKPLPTYRIDRMDEVLRAQVRSPKARPS